MKPLNSLCIVTQDVAALRDFYAAALNADPQGDGVFAWFSTPRADLSLYSIAGMEEMAPGSTQGLGYGGVVLEFGVDDVDAEYERLLNLGIPIVKPPTTQPWGIRSVWFRDPAGNVVNFNAPAGAQI